MILRHDHAASVTDCMPASVNIAGVSVVPFASYEHALDCVRETVESNQKSFWVAINPIKIYTAWKQPELLSLLRQCNVGFCDGVGVSFASRILHGRGICRITGCDLFFKLLSLASEKDWGIYLLGASPDANNAAYARLRRQFPALRIVGRQDGYFEESQEVVAEINQRGADLLFVAMGSPKQEDWIARHRHSLNAKFCMGVGGSFDVASGNVRRAPEVFLRTGTEFAYRILTEPLKRRKHVKILFCYVLRILKEKLTGAYAQNRTKPAVGSRAASL